MEDEVVPQIKQEDTLPKIKVLMALDILAIAATVFFLLANNPGEGGPTVVLIILGLQFLVIMLLSLTVLYIARTKFKLLMFSRLRMLYTSVAIAVGIVYLIGLQTLGQASLIDIILVLTFEALLNFYLIRRF